MVPHLYHRVVENKKFGIDREILDGFQALSISWAPTNFGGFVEGQIWGELSLKDVHAFRFQRSPPHRLFLQELRRLGIEIYDARGEPRRPWSGL